MWSRPWQVQARVRPRKIDTVGSNQFDLAQPMEEDYFATGVNDAPLTGVPLPVWNLTPDPSVVASPPAREQSISLNPARTIIDMYSDS